jgi:hypothetical protein
MVTHKVLTYIEYRAQCLASFELLTLHPLSTQRVCPSPGPKAGGYSLAGRGGGGGVDISEDARHLIGLLQYNPSTWSPLYRYLLHRVAEDFSLLVTMDPKPMQVRIFFIWSLFFISSCLSLSLSHMIKVKRLKF